jgi:hypothetical protein
MSKDKMAYSHTRNLVPRSEIQVLSSVEFSWKASAQGLI